MEKAKSQSITGKPGSRLNKNAWAVLGYQSYAEYWQAKQNSAKATRGK